MYIKIANRCSEVNRLHLEKLGLSTKRNDPTTIGQFGSGIKYAPISALRMGLDFVFCGSDAKGYYNLRYKPVDEDGIESIVYDYGDYQKQSSFTVDAGCMSWDSEWQIYREVISNAKDNGDWTRDLVSEIQNNPNEFAVYITASRGMMEVYEKHDYYFSDDRKVVYLDDYTGISFLEKINSSMHHYYKSVLVNTLESESKVCLFDYETNNATLNEDRELKDVSTEFIKINKTIARCKDRKVVTKILDKMFEVDLMEFSMISEFHWTYTSPSDLWKEVFYEKFSDDAVIVSPEQSLISGFTQIIKSSGRKPVVCLTNSIYLFLSTCEINKAEDVIGEESKYDIDEDISKYPKLIEAMRIASYFEPGINDMPNPLAVFENKNDSAVVGVTINMNKETEKQILVSSDSAADSTTKEILATIIHEYDHYSTGVSDNMYREFRNLADKRIANLMFKFYKETPVVIHNGILKIKTIDLPLFSSLDYLMEYIPSFGWHLVRIGKLEFKLVTPQLKSTMPIKKSGVCQVDETGQHFIIDIGLHGTIERIA
jgi:hypothetical protein